MEFSNKKYILFVYGEGGHTAQMNRFAPNLLSVLPGFSAITLSDMPKKAPWSSIHFVTSEFRNKHRWLKILTNPGPVFIFSRTFIVLFRKKIKVIVTTGPGMAIPAALAAKLLGVKIIYIETWSRFSTYSLSGRIMYHLSEKFYVQNESLLNLYPKAIFSGRL